MRQFAACLRDYRNADLIAHSVEELVAQRVYGLALGLPLKLRVRSIHSLMDAKFVEIGAIRGIQLSAAVILLVRVVIRHSLPTQIVVSA